MADKNTVKIVVPVEFQAELNSLKKIESSLKETLNKTNPGSALAKELTASLTKLRPMIAEYEKLFGEHKAMVENYEKLEVCLQKVGVILE